MTLRGKIKAAMPDIAVDWVVLIRKHREVHGQFPRILRPRTYNEKILRRNLLDRRRVFQQIADKWAVRSYVAERLGPEVLTRIYHVTDDPRTIPFDDLPEKFVVKPTHGSGWVEIVAEKSQCNPEEIINKCNDWLKRDYYKETREIPYRRIPRRIMVEEFVDDGHAAPTDYKFYVFGGRVEFFMVLANRFGDKRAAMFTREGKPFGALWTYHKPFSGLVPMPPQLEKLITAAETLGKSFDFIRADFYSTADRIWFGELTATPSGGVALLDREEYHEYLGSLWKPWRRFLLV